MDFMTAWEQRLKAYRNPVYLAYMIAAVVLFLVAALVASNGAGTIETPLFRFFNNLPEWLYHIMQVISIFGSFAIIIVAGFIATITRHYINAVKILMAGATAYFAAFAFKLLDIRARPQELLTNVHVREQALGQYGFPSGHVATATAVGIIVYQFTPKRYHRLITLMILLVAISRLYLGVHLPMDLVGGYAIGLFCGSLYTFAFGDIRPHAVPVEIMRRKMSRVRMQVASVRLAKVDARGSTPYFATRTDGGELFIKVVGRENNTADWLFKLWRKIVYRRLEDEAPFMSPKRQLEHEAYVAGLALANGVRTPRIIGIFEAASNQWAQVQEGIAGKSLDRVDPSLLTPNVLRGIWEQIKILHGANIIHRDLRTANIFLDEEHKPWLIDFGFSEASASDEADARDTVELLASMAALVGPVKSVASAKEIIGVDELKQAQPYLNYSVLSSATTKELKKRKTLLDEIRAEVAKATGEKAVKLESIKRFNTRMLLILIVAVLAVYVFLPQFGHFKDSFQAVQHAHIHLLLLGLVFSLGTYLAATAVYCLIAFYPIPYPRTLLVQVASSFTNRLLPAGTGGLATNARYLTKHNHTQIQAGSVAALNNFVGLLGHILMLVIIVLASKTRPSQVLVFRLSPILLLFIFLILAAATAAVIIVPKLRRTVKRIAKSMWEDFKLLLHQPFKLLGALLCSMAVTAFYALTLYASVIALGEHLSVLQVFVVFTVGVAAASVTPTPGGIGGAEAGIVAGLASVGIPANMGLSIALVYRFLTYWLPIIPGVIAFRYSMRKNYI